MIRSGVAVVQPVSFSNPAPRLASLLRHQRPTAVRIRFHDERIALGIALAEFNVGGVGCDATGEQSVPGARPWTRSFSWQTTALPLRRSRS